MTLELTMGIESRPLPTMLTVAPSCQTIISALQLACG